jgi:HEAT repeat protein
VGTQATQIFQRLGEEAGTLLVEALAESEQRAERRALVDALSKAKIGASALRHSLSDARWYVVRNAADLLGTYQAEGAAADLGRVLSHSDERVRRAAAAALAQLTAQGGTTDPLVRALTDPSPGVRQAAAGGLGLRRSPKSLAALLERLQKEDDGTVQAALLEALGRNASPTAVNALIEAAEPAGLFNRKAVSYRCAATAALRNVDTPQAKAALEKLKKDKEPQVRSAAGV